MALPVLEERVCGDRPGIQVRLEITRHPTLARDLSKHVIREGTGVHRDCAPIRPTRRHYDGLCRSGLRCGDILFVCQRGGPRWEATGSARRVPGVLYSYGSSENRPKISPAD